MALSARCVAAMMLGALLPLAAVTAQDTLTQARLQIYAGPLHREYMGCLNCDQYDVNSVWNRYSPFGWENDYINFSHFAAYRSQQGRYSACNPFAADPPIMIDISGKNYGFLNVSTKRTDSVCGPHGTQSICQPLTTMCARIAAPQP
jgi:hypothetical protein